MNVDETARSNAVERLVAQFGTFYYDELRHRMSLPLLARWLWADGRPDEALKLLLRYWRTGPDGVADRLLEASIRRRLGGPEDALPALRRAAVIDPTHPTVQRQLLDGLAEAGRAAEASAAARRLLASARDPDVLAAALASAEAGWEVFGVAELDGGTIEGWCVWRCDEPVRTLQLVADGLAAPFTVESQPHPVWTAGGAQQGRFRLAWPQGAAIVAVQDGPTGRLLRGSPMMNDEIFDDRRTMGDGAVEVSVVIPVYADAQATRACLESLVADRLTRTRRRVIVVDDASPDAMIRALLDRMAASGQILLLRNPQNVGFIRAVNRALRLVEGEDVVLLNADTMVPPGWLDRLREASSSAPDVGTVTPLSNNGEFVSCPMGFRPNSMPSMEQLLSLDMAAQALPGDLVDMPNGVGFCLYIRNDALRAVGGLDARHYERGYLEEVDFCLRIAAAGYRNVCLPTLVVAHQGEASFGASKRELVIANAAALVRRWPRIEAETETFVKADPLRFARAALAWPSLRPGRRRRLLVTGGTRPDQSIMARLLADAPALEVVALLVRGEAPADWTVLLPGLDDAVPLPADWRGCDPQDALGAMADLLGLDDIVLLGQPETPAAIPALAADLGLPVDLFVQEGPQVWAGAPPRRVLLPSASARRMLERDLAAGAVLLDNPGEGGLATPGGGRHAMGLIPGDASAATFAAIRDLARALHRRGSSRPLIVFGSTFRDVGLLRLGNVFVTGRLETDDDWREAFRAHPCGGLLLTQSRPVFSHPSFDVVRRAGLPFAAMAVGGAEDLLMEVPDGLALDPSWSADELAFVVDTFLSATAVAGVRIPLSEVA